MTKMDFSGFFEEWYDVHKIEEGIANRTIVTGSLRINKKNRREAFVNSSKFKVDIYIDGEKHRNRALDGDIVAVELEPQEHWRETGAQGAATNDLVNAFENIKLTDDVGLWQPLVPENSPAAQPPKPPCSKQDEAKRDVENLQPRGRVVGVLASNEENAISLQRSHTQKHIGVLVPKYGFEREKPSVIIPGKPLPASESTVEFRPLDNRIPFMAVPRDQVPHEFLSDPSKFAPPNLRLFEVALANWDAKHRFPMGRLIRQVGEAGEIGPETDALLTENGCDHGPFPEAALQVLQETLPEEGEWSIPEEELRKRRDLRSSHRIFTIDPATAKDLDDALHIVRVPLGKVKGRNGLPLPEHFEVGVHIADVSYFLEPNTALDREAQRRSTTVYLVNKVIPMLPPILCEELCSLNEGVDRLAYSCIWRMTEDGDMLENSPAPWFGRTVIRSCARLDYGLAQRMVDGVVTKDSVDTGDTSDPSSWEARRQPEPPHTKQEVIDDVRNLLSVAMHRRKNRFDRKKGGALQLSATKMSFKRDGEGNPIGVCAYPIHDSNRTIEEYMLMANYLVAQKLILGAGTLAFIRNHPPPDPKSMASLMKMLESKGIEFDPTALASSAGLHATLERISQTESPRMVELVNHLLRKPMKSATYQTAGALKQRAWRHWALNIPYYTHFTSPIRRYADVMVHRELTAILDGTMHEYPETEDEIQGIAEHCNEKKEASKASQDASDKLFFCIYVKKLFKSGKPLTTRGVVQGMGPNSFTLLLPEFGLESLIHAQNDWNASQIHVAYMGEDEDEPKSRHHTPKGGRQNQLLSKNKTHEVDRKRSDEGGSPDDKKQANQKKEVCRLSMQISPFRMDGDNNKVSSQTLILELLTAVEVLLEPTLSQGCRIGFTPRFVKALGHEEHTN